MNLIRQQTFKQIIIKLSIWSLLLTSSTYLFGQTKFDPKSFSDDIVIGKVFATWCSYCRKEAIETNISIPKDTKFLYIVPADDYQKSVTFFQSINKKVEIAIISDKQIARWKIEIFPTTLIFYKGKLKNTIPGEIPPFQIEKQIQILKTEKK